MAEATYARCGGRYCRNVRHDRFCKHGPNLQTEDPAYSFGQVAPLHKDEGPLGHLPFAGLSLHHNFSQFPCAVFRVGDLRLPPIAHDPKPLPGSGLTPFADLCGGIDQKYRILGAHRSSPSPFCHLNPCDKKNLNDKFVVSQQVNCVSVNSGVFCCQR